MKIVDLELPLSHNPRIQDISVDCEGMHPHEEASTAWAPAACHGHPLNQGGFSRQSNSVLCKPDEKASLFATSANLPPEGVKKSKWYLQDLGFGVRKDG